MAELKPFTHRIYVDFSGDDGDPKTPGSSKCLCIAWIETTESDLYHNEGIVLQIKKTIGCRANDEIKYTSLRRHKNKKEALGLLSQLKINAVVVPVLKERITDEELRNPRTKKLVDLIHYFPLDRLIDYISKTSPNVYFQLIFDQVGWRGCEQDIYNSFKKDSGLDWGNARPDWIMFVKSGQNLMLQLADIVAGIGHEYIKSFRGVKLPPCTVCAIKGSLEHPCRLKQGNLILPSGELIRLIYHFLIKNEQGDTWENGFVVRPPAACREYMFVDCIFKKK
jgi:hypothetical protein